MFLLIMIILGPNAEIASIEFNSKETCEAARLSLEKKYFDEIPVLTSIGCYKK